MEQEHKRRPHYSGTHPKHFNEKYKEHNPEKYGETVKKVIGKGSTPAGMHLSIMVQEILEVLQIQPGQQGLDCTFGYGGHTKAMLEKLQGVGRVIALDVDPIESVKSKERLRSAGFGEDQLAVKLINFANIDQVAEEFGKFDFVLADLGVSSMQIDDPSRGFSYKVDGPLDLRMDPTHGVTAAQRLRELTKEELIGLFRENADEPHAEEIADKIIRKLSGGEKIDTTFALRDVIKEALCRLPAKEREEEAKKACQRCFQALRIDVNGEFEALYSLLEKLPDILNPGGRVVILTFHSGEDRLVKKAFKEGERNGIYREISKDVTRPSSEECFRNPRAKSTKLRYAIKA